MRKCTVRRGWVSDAAMSRKGKQMRFMLCVLVAFASLAVANDAYDDAHSVVTSGQITTGGPVWDGPFAELYSNGPWWNSAGTGEGGADESILESPMNTLGFGFQTANDNRMADDFVVPMGETWTIESITCFGYQTNSGITPTINGLYLALYDDGPTSSPSVVWGDITTNYFSSAAFSNVYRVSSAGGGTARPIMAVTADISPSVVLGEGQYWLWVQMDGTGASGPWAPPIAILGEQTTGDAYQYTDAWALALDSGTGTPQGIPFVLEGLPVALENTTWGQIKSVF